MVAGIEHNPIAPVRIWGLPLLPVTLDQTLDLIERHIASGRPSYFVTANLHTAMLARQDAALRSALEHAAFVLADGMPLVWSSRLRGTPLPERVAGSDLVPALCERAAQRGYRLFFLGGAPGVGAQAAENLRARFPGLQIVGVEVPPFRPLSPEEQIALIERIRAARADVLFVAFGQPKGELWLERHCEALGVPVGVQIGASLDFAAGRVARAPRWMQRSGLEWVYRFYLEPGRLAGRYAQNSVFVLRMLAADVVAALGRVTGFSR